MTSENVGQPERDEALRLIEVQMEKGATILEDIQSALKKASLLAKSQDTEQFEYGVAGQLITAEWERQKASWSRQAGLVDEHDEEREKHFRDAAAIVKNWIQVTTAVLEPTSPELADRFLGWGTSFLLEERTVRERFINLERKMREHLRCLLSIYEQVNLVGIPRKAPPLKGAEDMPLIFISHASSDKPIIDDFFDLLQTGCDIRQDDIFCSSVDGAGIKTGADFVKWIHGNLHRCDLAILFLTPNYFASRFCVAEMGAAWALGKDVFPLVVPDMPHEVGAVMLGRQTAVVNEIGLDDLRDRIAQLFPQAERPTARWSIKKEQFLEAFREKFPNLPGTQPADLAELERQRERLEAADQVIKKLRDEKQQLREQIRMLKSAKDPGEQTDPRLPQERFREVIELQHQLRMLLSGVRVGLQPIDSKTGVFFNVMPAYKKDYDQLRMTYQKWDLKASELLREYAPEQLERLTAGYQTIRDLVYLRPTCPPDSKLWFRETESTLGEIAVLIQELGKELTASSPSELPYDFREHFYDPSTQRHYDSPKDIRLLKKAECSYTHYPAIFEHPREGGDAILAYRLRGLPLPPAKFSLSFRCGILDKLYEEPSDVLVEESDFLMVEGNQVVFSIRIDGEEVFHLPRFDHIWSSPIKEGPLEAPRGDLTIEFRTNAMGEPRGNWAAWGNPILELYQ